MDETGPGSQNGVYLTVVIPVFNEEESLASLCEELHRSLERLNVTNEVLFVDDGSTDRSYAVLEELNQQYPGIRALRFRRNYRKAAALAAGFKGARGEVIVTMDADLQDDPAEIPNLLAALDQGCDLVSGWKLKRRDPLSKTLPSRLFNRVTSMVSGIRLHDFNCGLKAYRAEVTRAVRVYGEMHRYIPVLAYLAGYKVGEAKVRHHARRYGTTKYGLARFLNGFLDLMTVLFLSSRATSPLHFFGRVGIFFLAIGMVINGYFLWQWLTGHGLHIRPLLLLGVALVLLAVQFVSLGLMSELIVAGRHPEMEYRVRRRF